MGRIPLTERYPGIEKYWGLANASKPSEVCVTSTVPVQLVCERCGHTYFTRPVNIASKKRIWLCPKCSSELGGGSHRKVPVVCLDTSERFESITAAALWLTGGEGRTATTTAGIRQAIMHGTRVRGHRFAYEDPRRERELRAQRARKKGRAV